MTEKKEFPHFEPISGVKIASLAAGLRYSNRLDLALIELAPGTTLGAVFTQNRFCAAPVQIAKENLRLGTHSEPRYWLINTGYANAGTGLAGIEAAQNINSVLAELLQVSSTQILPFSTGVIGEALPTQKIKDALPELVSKLGVKLGENDWHALATAIMTTDTRPKGFFKEYEWENQKFRMGGVSKGAGMIKPNMATMLAYVVTDLSIAADLMQTMLSQAVDLSFNSISVDGDTSTNDACMFAATGVQSNLSINTSEGSFYEFVQGILNDVCLSLALEIIRDAEGATKCVCIEVSGAKKPNQARAVAETVAHSPLVKTALFAEDPNWGRILAAIGRAPIAELNVERVNIQLDDVLILKNGVSVEHYCEEQAAKVMRKPEFSIKIDLQSGVSTSKLWTTDLSYDYVKINADYRT